MAQTFGTRKLAAIAVVLALTGIASADDQKNIDRQLTALMIGTGFTRKIGGTLETRMGRPVNKKLAAVDPVRGIPGRAGVNVT